MVKVWLRLDSQSEDEALKLVFAEGTDISDVLLKAAATMQTGSLKPSELALHRVEHDGTTVCSTALSNRIVLSSLLDTVGGDEVNLVLRPKQIPIALPIAAASLSSSTPYRSVPTPSSSVHNVAVGGGNYRRSNTAHTTSITEGRSSSVTRAKSPLPVAPRRQAAAASAVSSAAVRRPSPAGFHRQQSSSTTDTRPTHTVAQPQSARVSSTPRTRSQDRAVDKERAPLSSRSSTAATSSPRPSASRLRDAPQDNARAVAGTSAASRNRQSATAVTGKTTNQRVSSSRLVPQIASGVSKVKDNTNDASDNGHLAHPNSAPKGGNPPPQPIVVIGCCTTFKPQWGNVLCATCKHSKQAHLIKLREQHKQQQGSGGRSYADPENMQHDVSIGSLHEVDRNYGTHRATPGSQERVGKRIDVSLLDPPSVGNLSLASPRDFDVEHDASGI